jgi:hypothetical protein
MKPELSYKAVKLYGEKFGVKWYSPDYISYSFIPLFRRMGYVWVHTSSVVRFCHLVQPDEFGALNRINFTIGGFNQVINNGKDTRAFKLIKIAEFERLTGIKL